MTAFKRKPCTAHKPQSTHKSFVGIKRKQRSTHRSFVSINRRPNPRPTTTRGKPKMIAFENAQKRAAEIPGMFFAPSLETLNSIKPGDLIKVCASGIPGEVFAERFWLIVQTVSDGEITGKVDNELIFHSLKVGEVITVKPENIFQHEKAEQC